MRIAVIDLGTNSFNLVIADHFQTDYSILYLEKFSVKLGEHGIYLNKIQEEAFWRGIDNLEIILSQIKNYKVDEIIAVGTSALRDTVNGYLFVSTVQKLFGLKVYVVSGSQEAELIYWGVKSALKIGHSNALIMDIGGGSVEFIIASDTQIAWKKSYNIGVARLLEKFNFPEPFSQDNLLVFEQYLDTELKDLFETLKQYPVCELIGSSGSFDSLAEMICAELYTDDLFRGKPSFNFQLNDLELISQKILKSTRKERMYMKGLIDMRVDMIVYSTVMINHIIKRINIEKVRLSTFSLKEGILYNLENFKKYF